MNQGIRAPELRVVSETGENLGVLNTSEALRLAEERELDLIEISSSATPPIAKIIDYGKYKYQQEKKAGEMKKKSHETETKVVKIGVNTSEHDLEMKGKKASEFLKDKHRVKIDIFLKGRARYMNKNFIRERLERIYPFISEEYKIAQEPRNGPRGMNVIIEHA
jgi:translation initiation factor IF-3